MSKYYTLDTEYADEKEAEKAIDDLLQQMYAKIYDTHSPTPEKTTSDNLEVIIESKPNFIVSGRLQCVNRYGREYIVIDGKIIQFSIERSVDKFFVRIEVRLVS